MVPEPKPAGRGRPAGTSRRACGEPRGRPVVELLRSLERMEADLAEMRAEVERMRRHLVAQSPPVTVRRAVPLMSFATADLCDEFGDEVRVAEPLLRDWGGSAELRGPDRNRCGCFEDNALVREALEAPGGAGCWSWTAAARSGRALVGGNLAALGAPERLERTSSCTAASGTRRSSRGIAIGVKALEALPRKSAQGGDGRAGRTGDIRRGHLRPGRHLYADRDGMVVAERICWPG